MKNVNQLIGLTILFLTIGFNLWIYRLEPTARVDPNDNSFQFALVDRTNTIFDYAWQQCQNSKLKAQNNTLPIIHPLKILLCTMNFALLFDHWVPNWAQGYNLPYYYSHLPQIIIVGSYRLISFFSQFLISNFQFLMKISNFNFQMSLFQYYHWIIYVLLCFFPLSVFLALRVIGLPWIISGIGAFTASQLSTDGLYGLDPSSFLWRGFGLSSQLFAMIWLPLALAYSYRYFNEEGERQFLRELASGIVRWCKNLVQGRHLAREEARRDKEAMIRASRKNSSRTFLLPAILFLILTTAGHLGIGIMAILGLIPLAFGSLMLPLIQNIMDKSIQKIKDQITRNFLFAQYSLYFLLALSCSS